MHQWHPVTDVEPKSNGYKALVTARRPNGSIAGGGSGLGVATVQTTAIWVQGGWVTDTEGDEVTHWMPLPETPILAD